MEAQAQPQLQTVALGGRVLAIVPLDDYDALRDALEDAADAEAMRRALAEPEEIIPFAMVERMLDGENAVRAWCTHRNMKAGELATAAGISRSYLHAIENGDRQGSVDVLKRIANALSVSMDDLCG